MSLTIEKAYADLVTGDGTVCVVYLLRARWKRFSHPYAGVQLFHADGSRTCERAVDYRGEAISRPSSEELEIRLELPSGSLKLSYEVEDGPWSPGPDTDRPGLDWSVLMARGTGALTWANGSRRLEGQGYVDRVRLGRMPRQLGIRRLDWGRIHLARSTMVYTDVQFRDGHRWARTATWAEGEVEPRERAGPVDAGLSFDTVRILHRGPAIEAAPAPSRTERLVSRLLIGPACDDRRLSRARQLGTAVRDDGWAVHETIRGSGSHGGA